MNFFDISCQTGPHNQTRFGLCDDQSSAMAHVDVVAPATWIATVDNPGARDVMFTAIDKCVIKDGEQPGRGRCDCMLTTDDILFLVELKDRARGTWRADATSQLISTIEFLRQHHDLSPFRHKKAFVCNRKQRPFSTVNNDEQLEFFRSHGFRLDIQTTVLIRNS